MSLERAFSVDRTKESLDLRRFIGQKMPADLINSASGDEVLFAGSEITPKIADYLRKQRDLGNVKNVEFRKPGVVPTELALAVDVAEKAVDYLFKNVGDMVSATRSAVEKTTDTLKNLIDSGRIQFDERVFSAHVSQVLRALTSEDYKGGVVALEAMRLKGEKTTAEHGLETMMGSMVLMQYLKETRGEIGGVVITHDMIFQSGLGGLLHDAGKAVTPDEVLNFSGKFTPEQHRLIHAHTLHGPKILSNNGRNITFAAKAAAMHHLYPNFEDLKEGKRGYSPVIPETFGEVKMNLGALSAEENISLHNLKIAEIHSALTQSRPYNKLWESVIPSDSVHARDLGPTLIMMNQMCVKGSLHSLLYPVFYEMMTKPERTSFFRDAQTPKMFTNGSVMHLDKRDLSDENEKMLEPYEKLGLDPEGDYALVIQGDSYGARPVCDVIDFRLKGDYQSRRVMSDKLVDFSSILGFPPQ